ncbi:DNA glycosylase AlkZ-like family protein [Agrococcus sp. DT81.2]|uniref:DNA glycosylase AlkZ-like family protein n=1 Tax=Agrococcus sp. DT81.2 TaxID=3393414 RepID=UPI003CE465E3
MRELADVDARRMRLVAQGLVGSQRSPVDAVRHAVALQGQDLPAVLRAIAVRSAPGTTLDDVRAAFDAGELVRSWAMRGTLFVAAPDDLAVLHAATGERMRRQEWRMCEVRGIDQGTAELAADVLVDALADGPLPRPVMLAAWERAGISTAGGRGYHLLALNAYDGLVRFGPFEGRDQLLVGGPRAAVADPERALDAALARMVAARGPMDADDVAWWMGLPKTLVRASLARASELDPGIELVRVGDREMLIATDAAPGVETDVVLVPAFDEVLLGYRDRTLLATPDVLAAVVPGGNGVFRPMVLVDGVAVGTWRFPAARARVAQLKAPAEPVLELVGPVPARLRHRIDRALAAWPHR